MSPTIVLQPSLADGVFSRRVRAVVGANGGPAIITAVAQVLVNALYRGVEPRDAVGRARVHHQYSPNKVQAEDWQMLDGGWERVAAAVLGGLRARGHAVELGRRHGNVQLVLQDLDTLALTGVSDRRKSGRPAGV